MTKKNAPKSKKNSGIKSLIDKVQKTKPVSVCNAKLNIDNDEADENTKGIKYKCLDCGKGHHSTLVRYVTVYFGRKSAKNRITVIRRLCMKCESDNISELIQNKKCKNYGLTWKEVMANIVEKEKPRHIEVKHDEGEVIVSVEKKALTITYGEFA